VDNFIKVILRTISLKVKENTILMMVAFKDNGKME
jgi:hypothetical protein